MTNKNKGLSIYLLIVLIIIAGTVGLIYYLQKDNGIKDLKTPLKDDSAEIFNIVEDDIEQQNELLLQLQGSSSNTAPGDSTSRGVNINSDDKKRTPQEGENIEQKRTPQEGENIEQNRITFDTKTNPFTKKRDFENIKGENIKIDTSNLNPTQNFTPPTIPRPSIKDIFSPNIETPTPQNPSDNNLNEINPVNTVTPTLPEISGESFSYTSKSKKYGLDDALSGVAIATAASLVACYLLGLLNFDTFTVATTDGTQKNKECTLDSVAYNAAKNISYKLAGNYIEWASGGFEGKPLFIDNPSLFWSGVINDEVGRILDETGFGFLCNGDYLIDIKANLQIQYSNIRVAPPKCSLSEYKANIRNLIDDPINLDFNLSGGPTNTLTFGSNKQTDILGIDPNLEGGVSINADFDATESIKKATQNIYNYVKKRDPNTLPLGRLGNAQAAIEEKRAEIGARPTVREQIENPNESNSLAAYRECTPEENPNKYLYCVKIVNSGKFISDSVQQEQERTNEAINEADEFGEILGNLANATVYGLFKKVRDEGLSSDLRPSIKRIRREAIRLQDPLSTSEGSYLKLLSALDVPNGRNLDIPIAKLENNDFENLFKYIEGSYPTNTPGTYTNDKLGNRYKIHSGKLLSNFTNETSLFGTEIKNYIDKINSTRKIYEKCTSSTNKKGNEEPRCERTKDVLGIGFLYPEDSNELKNILNKAKTEQIQKNAKTFDALSSILNSTILAYEKIIGTPSEYERSAVSSEIANIRETLLNTSENIKKIQNGESRMEVIYENIEELFEENTASLYIAAPSISSVNTDYQVLWSASSKLSDRCVWSLDSNNKFEEKIESFYKTTCTIKELFDIAQSYTSPTNIVPSDIGDFIELVYEIGRETELITLPRDSEAGIISNNITITNYKNVQDLSMLYGILGNVFSNGLLKIDFLQTRENDGTFTQSGTENVNQFNLGSLLPKQAKDVYRFNFGKKFEFWYTKYLADISSEE